MIELNDVKMMIFEPNDNILTYDAIIQSMINETIGQAESYLNGKLVAVSDEIIYLDGGGKIKFIPHFNISNVTIWMDSFRQFTDDTILDQNSFYVYRERGIVIKNYDFINGHQVLKVKYDGGYSTQTLPSQLKHAIVKQIVYEFRRRKDIGLMSVTYPDGTINKMSIDEWLPDVKQILNRYRRVFL